VSLACMFYGTISHSLSNILYLHLPVFLQSLHGCYTFSDFFLISKHFKGKHFNLYTNAHFLTSSKVHISDTHGRRCRLMYGIPRPCNIAAPRGRRIACNSDSYMNAHRPTRHQLDKQCRTAIIISRMPDGHLMPPERP